MPIGLHIEWDGGGKHAFTMYGIDTDAQTITFACSDSDRGGTDFVTRHYTWSGGVWDIDYAGDGQYHELIGAGTFGVRTATRRSGRRWRSPRTSTNKCP